MTHGFKLPHLWEYAGRVVIGFRGSKGDQKMGAAAILRCEYTGRHANEVGGFDILRGVDAAIPLVGNGYHNVVRLLRTMPVHSSGPCAPVV